MMYKQERQTLWANKKERGGHTRYHCRLGRNERGNFKKISLRNNNKINIRNFSEHGLQNETVYVTKEKAIVEHGGPRLVKFAVSKNRSMGGFKLTTILSQTLQ